MPNKFLFFFTLLLILNINIHVLAEDKSLEVNIDKDDIPLSGSIRLDLTFHGVKDMPAPGLPEIDGFKSTYLRSSNIISKSDGRILCSTRHTYVLMPNRSGLFKIGPFEFLHNGNRYISKQTTVRVLSGLPRLKEEEVEISAEERFRAKENAFLLIELDKDEVYVNELFPLYINLYYKDIWLTDIQYPTIQHEGFSLGEFRRPHKSRKSLKGYDYHVISFRNHIFATRPGELKLGPAILMCNLQIPKSKMGYKEAVESIKKYASKDMFRKDVLKEIHERYKKHPFRLESIAKHITAIALPEAGKPYDFSGAVGNFRFKTQAEPRGYIKIGDAITVKMEISGKGNFAIISAPAIKEDEAFVLYEPYLKEEGETYKIFEQVLIPRTTALKEIPEVRFSFFNPEETKYITITQGPVPIKVVEIEKVKEAEIIEKPEGIEVKPEEEVIGRDIIYIKDSPGRFKKSGAYLYKHSWFLFSQTLPFFLYLSTLVLYKRYQRLKNDIRYARHRVAYRKSKKGLDKAGSLLEYNRPEEFYNHLFSTMQEYFGDKFNLPSGGITAHIVDELLAPKGFEEAVLNKVRRFFKECDVARFTPGRHEKKDMMHTLSDAKVIVEYFRKV